MNFTGYKKPTDEEFKRCYKELFEASPRPKEYETKQYKAKVELARKRFFEFQKIAMNVGTLPWEIWKPHPKYELWEVSNLGRVRIDGKIQEQIEIQMMNCSPLAYFTIQKNICN